jgi:hypothetical protein
MERRSSVLAGPRGHARREYAEHDLCGTGTLATAGLLSPDNTTPRFEAQGGARVSRRVFGGGVG